MVGPCHGAPHRPAPGASDRATAPASPEQRLQIATAVLTGIEIWVLISVLRPGAARPTTEPQPSGTAAPAAVTRSSRGPSRGRGPARAGPARARAARQPITMPVAGGAAMLVPPPVQVPPAAGRDG